MGAFIGLDAFQVTHVPEALVLVEDTDPAQNVASSPGGVERDLNVVHLSHGNVIMLRRAGVSQSRQTEGEQLGFRNLSQHSRQLRLHQLEAPDGAIELHAAHRVPPRLVITSHRRSQHAPRDSVTRLIKA